MDTVKKWFLVDISQASSENLLFSVDGDFLRDPQLAKVHSVRECRVLIPKGKIFTTTPLQGSEIIVEAEADFM